MIERRVIDVLNPQRGRSQEGMRQQFAGIGNTGKDQS